LACFVLDPRERSAASATAHETNATSVQSFVKTFRPDRINEVSSKTQGLILSTEVEMDDRSARTEKIDKSIEAMKTMKTMKAANGIRKTCNRYIGSA
jgi:hypothetical protein